jgi:hypothetical protein
LTCDVCSDRGILIVDWPAEGEPQYALCLCPAAAWYRRNTNAGKTVAYGWQVWCAVNQVAPERVARLEELYSAEELAAVGLGETGVLPADREAVLLKAARKRAKL